jgi:hypothetical protein
MKRTLMIFCAALALAGCNQGGTSDQYSTGTGTATSRTNGPTSINMPPPAAVPNSSSFSNNPSLNPVGASNLNVTRPGDRPNPSRQP